jgi:hypothetical protein
MDPKTQVIEIKTDGNDLVMESIIASGPSHENVQKTKYLKTRKDHSHEENTCEKYDNVEESEWRLFEE